MRENDIAGLALLNRPYAWIGVRRSANGFALELYDQLADSTVEAPMRSDRVWLRVESDFLTEQSRFSYSSDGKRWTPLGKPFTTAFQLKTFQGVRFALFHYNTGERPGGFADFDWMDIYEPNPRGLMQPIPTGRVIALRSAGRGTPLSVDGRMRFTVVDRELGRVALRTGESYVSVSRTSDSTSTVRLRVGPPGESETFQWMETMYGDIVLMSLATNRYLFLDADGRVTASSRGPEPDPTDGTALRWRPASRVK
ncbi:MAG TPA: hypothetical protein VIP11_21960, partial [Gemmatimonadaceae bacterium]